MRILAIADTHVSAEMTLAGCRPQTPTGPLVLAQAARSLAWVRQMVIDHKVDLVVHLGDVYEIARPGPAAETVAIEGLLSISEYAPVVVIPGNHDIPVGGGVHAVTPMRAISPRLIVADSQVPVTLRPTRLVGQMADLVTIYPIPYPHRSAYPIAANSPEELSGHLSACLDRVLTAHSVSARQDRERGTLSVMLYHGTVSGAEFRPHQIAPAHDVQIVADARWQAFDLALAGHIHKRQRLPGLPGLPCYVGALDRHDFGEEDDQPGALLFDVSSGEPVIEAFLPNPHARRFVSLNADSLLPLARAGLALGPGGSGLGFDGADGFDVDDDRLVMRIRGEVEPEDFDVLGRLVRNWRAAGWRVANSCAVIERARARVALERVDASAALDAVFAARPDLEPDRAAIMARIGSILR